MIFSITYLSGKRKSWQWHSIILKETTRVAHNGVPKTAERAMVYFTEFHFCRAWSGMILSKSACA
jgi:hypothetical protein